MGPVTYSYAEFQRLLNYYITRFPDWRTGQTAFNLLLSIDPDFAETIRATPADPFHNDDKLPAFLAKVVERTAVPQGSGC